LITYQGAMVLVMKPFFYVRVVSILLLSFSKITAMDLDVGLKEPSPTL
jgi:hypothetical protein